MTELVRWAQSEEVRWSGLILAVLVAVAAACDCKRTLACDCAVGVPRILLNSPTDGGVTAQDPNPCEIDLDFGTVATGQPVTAAIEIENIGAGSLDFAQVDPDLGPAFVLQYDLDKRSIAPGSFGLFHVTFTARDAGSVAATFNIQDDGLNSSCPDPSTLTLVLSGTGSS